MANFKNLENGLIYTQLGTTEKKVLMGKEFTLMHCKTSEGKCCLVPVEKFNNPALYKKVN